MVGELKHGLEVANLRDGDEDQLCFHLHLFSQWGSSPSSSTYTGFFLEDGSRNRYGLYYYYYIKNNLIFFMGIPPLDQFIHKNNGSFSGDPLSFVFAWFL